MKKLYFSVFAALLFFNIINAQNHQLININQNANTTYSALSDVEKKSNVIFNNSLLVRPININQLLTNVQNITAGDTLLLDLFQGKQYKAYIDKINNADVNGVISLRARIIGYQSGFCFIFISSNNYFFNITIPELKEQYFIKKATGTNNYYLIQVNTSQSDILEGGESMHKPIIVKDTTTTVKPANKFQAPMRAPSASDTANIDIMILYTPAAASWSNTNDGGINNTISNIMAASQLAFDNSQTAININLVHSEQISYTESGNTQLDLYRLTFYEGFDPYQLENGPSWYMEGAHTLRDQYAADIVVLLTETSDTGGLSFLLENPNGDPSYGYSIVRVQQATGDNTTAIHEIGHDMGCAHSKLQKVQPGPGLFSYSAGWRWQSDDNNYYCDLMAYSNGSYFADGITHTRVLYFSSPLVNYLGVATGDSTNGDNARTLREIKQIVAAYREPVGQNCIINTSLNASDRGNVTGAGTYTSGQTVTLKATANSGYFFRDWTEFGDEVSTSATYSFTATGNRTLVANFSNDVQSCSGGTLNPANSLTPTTTWQTETGISIGDYSVFDVVNGQQYTWSLCPADGGNISYDSQLSLINDATLALLSYNDNACGVFSKITWTATFTGKVRVLINAYDCEIVNSSVTLAYIQNATTGINTPNNNNDYKINLYPNPVKDQLTISVDQTYINNHFEILSLTGQTIYNGILKEKTEVSMSRFAEGIYLLKVSNGKSIETRQFIKN
jgi:hypothetical protein